LRFLLTANKQNGAYEKYMVPIVNALYNVRKNIVVSPANPPPSYAIAETSSLRF
jgi:hypothetical protein